jgi:hypothetical protein
MNVTKLGRCIYVWLYSPWGPWPFFQFLNLYTARRTTWTGDQLIARPLHRTTQTQNRRTQTSIYRVEFEAMTPVFEWAKTVHTLDSAAIVIGSWVGLPFIYRPYFVHIFHSKHLLIFCQIKSKSEII